MAKIGILNTHNLFCQIFATVSELSPKFAMSLRKLQLLFHVVFLTHDGAGS